MGNLMGRALVIMPGGKQAGRAEVVESLRQAREAGADAETSAETIAELMNSQPEAGERQPEDSDDGDEPDWGWDGEEEGSEACCVDLFSAEKFPTVPLMLQNCIEAHKFDLEGFQQQHALGMYETLKLINYIRGAVSNQGAEATLEKLRDGGLPDDFDQDSDALLKPALQDDPLLLHPFDDNEAWSSDEQ